MVPPLQHGAVAGRIGLLDLHLDPELFRRRLEHLCRALLDRVGAKRRLDADRRIHPRFVDEALCLVHVVGERPVVRVVERTPRQDAVVADGAGSEIRDLVQRLAVDRPLERLPELLAVAGILRAEVETEVLPAEPDLLRDHDVARFAQAPDVLQRQGLRELYAARAKLREAGAVDGNGPEDEPVHARLALVPVLPVPLQDRMRVLEVFRRLEGAGAGRVQSVVLAPSLERGGRSDAARHVDEGEEERREGVLEGELDGVAVDDLHRVEGPDLPPSNRPGVGVADPFDVVAHRLGVEVGAVVELHPLAQREEDRPAVLPFPRVREVRSEPSRLVHREQGVVYRLGRGPPLEVPGEVRVEGEGVGEDGDGQGVSALHRGRRPHREREHAARGGGRGVLQEVSSSGHVQGSLAQVWPEGR